MMFDELTDAQKKSVVDGYSYSELVMSNLHRIRVQIGKTGIVMSVTTPWIFDTGKISSDSATFLQRPKESRPTSDYLN